MWRIHDLENPDADEVMKRLMSEMKPLYEQLHAYVRAQLVKMYSSQVNNTAYENILDPEGPIPAHLLGNRLSNVENQNFNQRYFNANETKWKCVS